MSDDGEANPGTGAPDPSRGPAWSGDGPPPGSSATGSARRTRRSRRRAIAIGAVTFVVLLLAALVWLLYTGLRARHELEAARAGVRTLRADISVGDLDGARAAAASLRTHADRAHDLTTGPLWAAAAAVPRLGAPLSTTRAVTSGVAALADDALPALVHAVDSLDPSSLRSADGGIDVRSIESVAPGLDHAVTVLGDVTDRIRDSSGDTWVGSVNTARADLLGQLGGLASSVRNADTAAAVLPTMLGAHRPVRYMITFQNEAELRGTGGLPGAFAIMQADRGRIRFLRFEPDNELSGLESGVRLGKDFAALWTADPTGAYVNSNQSPHFPYAARIWTAMWQRKSGQHLDGAIALDPTTLSYLLAVTGPATMPDGSKVTASNVVRLTQSDVYRRFATDNNARKKYLLNIARAVSDRLLNGRGDPTALVKAAGRAAGEYRLLVWTRDAAVEKRLSAYPIAGSVPVLSVPYAGLTLINGGGNKLDYYLHASFTWRRTGCGATRDVVATIRLRNDAPAHGLPDYVTDVNSAAVPGVQRLDVVYFASGGAQLAAATHNGAALSVTEGTERGHPAVVFAVDLPIGRTQTFVLHLREPGGPNRPTVRVQPMVHPMTTTVQDEACTS